jgi:arsenate reductase
MTRRILFLCTHNRCRSILAEAIFNQTADDRIIAVSAGSEPQGEVHPQTLAQLERRGFATQGLASKPWDAHEADPPDVVVTVCDQAAGESCPLWLGDTPKVHWGLPDPTRAPAAQQEALFDAVIDSLVERAESLNKRFPAEDDPAALAAVLEDIAREEPLQGAA